MLFFCLRGMSQAIFTVGHSTHTIERFIELLWRHHVGAVGDVRRHPGSQRMPQFNRLEMDEALAGEAIRYIHFPELGGRRRPRPDTPNRGWESEAFQGYADHMATEEFSADLARLDQLARERVTAVMCAEAVWWRCHRRLISDALLLRGWSVRHIGADGRLSEHRMTPFAVASGLHLTYPPAQQSLNLR